MRVFAAIAVGMTVTAMVFAAIALRRGGELLPEPAPVVAS
jgi:hypothetical protein